VVSSRPAAQHPFFAEKIHPIATADYLLPATRPQNSRLDCSLLENVFQLKLPPWQNGVKQAISLILNEI
jgi:dTDP-4-dehydrorhamnose reductase